MLATSLPSYYPYPTLRQLCRRITEHLQPWELPSYRIHSHSVSVTTLHPGSTVPYHIHPFHEGFLVLSGSIELTMLHQQHRLAPGSLALFSPGITHHWRANEEEAYLLVLSFDLDPPVQTPRTITWPIYPALCWEAQWLFDDVGEEAPGWVERVHCRLGLFYAYLLQFFSASPSPAPTTLQLAQRVDVLLEMHLVSGITLDALAEDLSMSVRHLTRQFRTSTGMTIGARLEALRLERAAKLLLTTRLPIADIAQAVGFLDADYFARRFAGRFTLLPSQYRKRQSS